LQQGDTSVFPKLVALTQDMVYNTALSIVQNSADAEDITQEVFVTLYQKAGAFRGEADWKTWIYRICIHKSLDHEKKKRRIKNGGFLKRVFNPAPGDLPADFNHPGVQYANKEMAKQLFAAIRQLPEKQRLVFHMKYFEEMKYEDISVVERFYSGAFYLILTPKNIK
jgi:RNA polymerase sigma-70 factor (ECF subfamily)